MDVLGYLKKTCACLCAVIMLTCGLPLTEASFSDNAKAYAASTKTNTWQIPDEALYNPNDPLKNTTYGLTQYSSYILDSWNDSPYNVRKTLEPTDTENVFIEHLSIDVNLTETQSSSNPPSFSCVGICEKVYDDGVSYSEFKTQDGSIGKEPPEESKDRNYYGYYWIPQFHDALTTETVTSENGGTETWAYGVATCSYRVDLSNTEFRWPKHITSSYSKDGVISASAYSLAEDTWSMQWTYESTQVGQPTGVGMSYLFVHALLYDKFFWCSDGKGNPVKGAVFTLDGDENTGISNLSATSDESGKVSFTGLPTGEYSLKLSSVPEGSTVDFKNESFTCSYTNNPDAYTYSPFDETHVMLKAESKAYSNGIEKPKENKPAAKTPSAEELELNLGVKVKQSGKKVKVSWGKVNGASGYDVYVQYCSKKFNKKSCTRVKGGSKTSLSVKKIYGKKIDFNKNYKIYVRAYKKSNGKEKTLAKSITMHFVGSKASKYTNAKNIKLSKKSYTLTVGKSAKIKGKVVLVDKKKKQLSKKHAATLRFVSSKPSVATVSKSGKITAKGKGTCKVYVYAKNGYTKVVKVTVK